MCEENVVGSFPLGLVSRECEHASMSGSGVRGDFRDALAFALDLEAGLMSTKVAATPALRHVDV